jgi:hypothetical protein
MEARGGRASFELRIWKCVLLMGEEIAKFIGWKVGELRKFRDEAALKPSVGAKLWSVDTTRKLFKYIPYH